MRRHPLNAEARTRALSATCLAGTAKAIALKCGILQEDRQYIEMPSGKIMMEDGKPVGDLAMEGPDFHDPDLQGVGSSFLFSGHI